MPVSLEQLYRSKTRTITLELGEERAAVVYKPLAITPAMFERANDGVETPHQLYSRIVLEVVERWEIVDAAGQPCPITQEFLNSLSDEFLNLVVDAIFEDRRAPNDGEKKASGGGS